jgi:hypothetical protein
MEEGVDGGLARGVARGGANHAMAVNETVTAFVCGGTAPDAAAGICGIEAFRTETHLPIASGSKAAVRVDAVLRAPAAGVPVLMIEVDRGTESRERVAEKLARYDQYFARPIYDGKRHNSITSVGEPEKLHWHTHFPPTGRPGTPPVAMVFTGLFRNALAGRITRVMDLARKHWWYSFSEYHTGSGGVPLLVAMLDDLTAHGPKARSGTGPAATRNCAASSRRWTTPGTESPSRQQARTAVSGGLVAVAAHTFLLAPDVLGQVHLSEPPTAPPYRHRRALVSHHL